MGNLVTFYAELKHAIGSTNDKNNQPNDETAQIASSMNEMSTTIANVNDNAVQSADNVEQV